MAGPNIRFVAGATPTGVPSPQNMASSVMPPMFNGNGIPGAESFFQGAPMAMHSMNLMSTAMMRQSFLIDTSLRPPSLDEQLLTIFISSIPSELSDLWLGKLLRASGPLKSWIRVDDSLGNKKDIAFAEYEDFASLSRAATILSEIEIPVVEIEEGEELENEEEASKTPQKLSVSLYLVDSAQIHYSNESR